MRSPKLLGHNHADEFTFASAVTKFSTDRSRLLLALTVIAYWAVGSYPYHFFSPFGDHQNIVEKTTRGGLAFPERGIAYTNGPPQWMEAAIKENALEVELHVFSYDVHQNGPARIFTVSHDHYSRNLTIGQNNKDLVVRLRTVETGPNSVPAHIVPQVFRNSGPHRIVVRVSAQGIHIEVNGQQRLAAELPLNALSTWNPDYRLALGNEFTFQRPWRGKIRSAIVRADGDEIDYTGAGLRLPQMYTVDRELFLSELGRAASLTLHGAHTIDWLINFFGFVPFGVLLVLVRRKPISLPVAFGCCAALSLSIEIGQLFFETRSPQAMDSLLNTLGGGLGFWAANRIRTLPEILRSDSSN